MEEEIEEMFKEDDKRLLISNIMSLQSKIENKTNEITKLTEELDALKVELDSDKSALLEMMKEDKQDEVSFGRLFANCFRKKEFSYGDEKALLSKLQEMSLNKYIKTTTTTKTSIDKNTLKKDLKVDEKLKESLKDFIGDRLTEWVVVTDIVTHQRMLEHIEESMKK